MSALGGALPLSAFLPAEITDVEMRNMPGENKKACSRESQVGLSSSLRAEDRASSVISVWQMLGSYSHRMQRTPLERLQRGFALDVARADVLLYSGKKNHSTPGFPASVIPFYAKNALCASVRAVN